MAKTTGNGLWLRLSVGFFRHPKVAVLSVEAKLLLLELICYSVEFSTDGFVPGAVVDALTYPQVKRGAFTKDSKRIPGDVGYVSVRENSKDADSGQLPAETNIEEGYPYRKLGVADITRNIVEELLNNSKEFPSLIRVGGGYQIHDYADWQTTAEEAAACKERGRKGGLAKAENARNARLGDVIDRIKNSGAAEKNVKDATRDATSEKRVASQKQLNNPRGTNKPVFEHDNKQNVAEPLQAASKSLGTKTKTKYIPPSAKASGGAGGRERIPENPRTSAQTLPDTATATHAGTLPHGPKLPHEADFDFDFSTWPGKTHTTPGNTQPVKRGRHRTPETPLTSDFTPSAVDREAALEAHPSIDIEATNQRFLAKNAGGSARDWHTRWRNFARKHPTLKADTPSSGPEIVELLPGSGQPIRAEYRHGSRPEDWLNLTHSPSDASNTPPLGNHPNPAPFGDEPPF